MKLEELCPLPLPNTNAVGSLPREVFIGPAVADTIAGIIRRHAGPSVLLVCDPDTRVAAEQRGVEIDKLAERVDVVKLGAHPHADDAHIALVAGKAREVAPDGLVAVGSGTVNDIVKKAASELELPFVVVGTAASMNGYASGIAAILSRGLKTTVPAWPARAIALDTRILADAPPALAQAGLGDLLSKPVSDSDWWLGDQIEGGGYSDFPGALVEHAVREATAAAAGLPRGDNAAYEALARALVLSGVSMVVAGSSSPASGGEHLISHLWDMEALAAGRSTRLHGAQVGVATCITASLYQALIRLDSPALTTPPPWSIETDRIRSDHGRLASALIGPAESKHARAEARVARLRDHWPEYRDHLSAARLPTPAQVRAPLQAAGAPHTLDALGISRADAARALRLARDIRDRVTVLDVAFELGLLPGAVDEILDAAGV